MKQFLLDLGMWPTFPRWVRWRARVRRLWENRYEVKYGSK